MPKINVKRMKVRKKNNEWEAVPGFGEGVYPVDKTAAMTQPVGRDAQGRLFTAPTGGGGGGTVDVDPTLTQEGMAADAKAVGDAIGDKITAPTSGSVGDVLTVSAVDGEGKPVAVKTQKGVLTDDQELTEQEKSFARRNIGALKNNVYLNWDDAIRELVDGDGDDTLCFVQSDNTVTSGDAQLKLPAMILVYQGSWDYKPFTVYDSNGETFKGVLGAAVTGDDGRRWFFEKATAGQPLAIKLISDTDDNGNVTYSVDKTAAELENAVKNRTMCYLYSGDRIYQFQDTHTSPNGDINIGFSSTAEQSRLFDAEFVNIFVSQSGTKVSVYVFTEPLLLGATFFIQESLDGDLLGGTTNNAFADAVCLRQSIDYIHWELPTTGAISANIKTLDEDENPIATKLLTDGKMTTDGENFVVTFDDLKDGVRYTVTGNLNDGEDEERLIFSTVTKEDIGAADDTNARQVQADWDENDENSGAYVRNRPFHKMPPIELATFPMVYRGNNSLGYAPDDSDGQDAIRALAEYLLNVLYDKGYSDNGRFSLSVTVAGKTYEYNNGMEEMGYVVIGGGSVNISESGYSVGVSCDTEGLVTGSTYDVLFVDTSVYVKPIDELYFPDTIFSQENAPVRFGTGEKSAVQGYSTTASGDYSHAEGYGAKASERYSHAEGYYTTASGRYSHAEGDYTTASRNSSHAEGYHTTASGYYSHAEGYYTTASGRYSHAEGHYTTARRKGAVVFGRANLPDEETVLYKEHRARESFKSTTQYTVAASYKIDEATKSLVLINPQTKTGDQLPVGWYCGSGKQMYQIISKVETSGSNTIYECDEIYVYFGDSEDVGKYALTVGNGILEDHDEVYKASNAHTLDWDGNAWFSGKVYVGSTSGTNRDSGSKVLATQEEVEEAVDYLWEYLTPTTVLVEATETGDYAIAETHPAQLEDILSAVANDGIFLPLNLALGRDGGAIVLANSRFILDSSDNVFNATWEFPAPKENAVYKLTCTLSDETETANGLPFAVTREVVAAPALESVILQSSTPDSAKKFRITVDDSGTISATEVDG